MGCRRCLPREFDISTGHAQRSHAHTGGLEGAGVVDTRDPGVHIVLFMGLEKDVASIRKHES